MHKTYHTCTLLWPGAGKQFLRALQQQSPTLTGKHYDAAGSVMKANDAFSVFTRQLVTANVLRDTWCPLSMQRWSPLSFVKGNKTDKLQ